MPRLAGVTAALNQGLQVGYNEAQRVQDDPGHDDALQPAGSFFNGSLIAGNHADQQCNGCDCDGNDGADGNDLTVNILSGHARCRCYDLQGHLSVSGNLQRRQIAAESAPPVHRIVTAFYFS